MRDTQENTRNRNFSSNSTESQSSSESSSEYFVPAAPDGGWGWLVVFASFIIHCIADGCAFSFGVFYVELLDHFRESKSKTSLVGSLFVSVPLFMGPLTSAITNKYGCRRTTISGGVIAGVGCILSVFAPSIDVLCITFGLITGFGLSLVYMPAVVIVAHYFEKRRAFATGIAVSGSGIGTFIFAPLTEYLITSYTWKGAMLLIGGIMFNITVAGSLFRPLETKRERRKRKYLKKLEKFSRNSSRLSFYDYAATHSGTPERSHNCGDASRYLQRLISEPFAQSQVQLPTHIKHEIDLALPEIFPEGKTFEEILADHQLLRKLTHSMEDITTRPAAESTQKTQEAHGSKSDTTNNMTVRKSKGTLVKELLGKRTQRVSSNRRGPGGDLYLPPLSRKDIFYRGSLARTQINQLQIKSSSCPDIFVHSESSSETDLAERCMEIPGEIKHIMKKMMDTAILKDVVFLYFCISNMILYMWYDVPYIYLPDKAVEMKIPDEKASFLISITGIVNTLGQIIIGFIGDHPKVSSVHFYNFLTSATGVATMLAPLCVNYISLCAYSAAFGFFVSGNYALTTIILVDLLGMDKLTNAYGIIMFSQGISNLVGPPLAG